MLEESIDGSPHKANSSIHRARMRRKEQRKRLEDRKKEEQPQRAQLTLAAMYWENDDQDHRKATRNLPLNFDPFEDQKLLAAADRITSTQQKQDKRQSNLTATVGFQKCEDLKELLVVHEELHDAFEISDTEMLLICKQAEEAEEAEKLAECEETTTPPQSQKTKSIVDLILEDFGCSPLSPPLEFKRTRRTYSRRRKDAKDSFAERLEGVAMVIPPPIDNDLQEDRTQPPQPPPVPYFSQKVYENLLNLSAYFTQHHPEKNQNQTESLKTELGLEEEKECLESAPKSVALTQTHVEILTLRQKYPVSFRRRSSSSSDEFYGFPEENGEGVNDKTADLRAGNAGQLSQTSQNSETKTPPAECTSSPTVEPGNLIKQCDSKLSDTKSRIIHKDEPLFSDDDCEFFVNFKTQDALKAAAIKKLAVQATNVPSSSATASTKLNAMHSKDLPVLEGFQTAGSKKIYISAAAQARAAQLLQDLPELPVKKAEKFEGFQTASRKTIEISEAARKRAESVLADVPELENFDFLDDDQPCTSKAAAFKQAARNAALSTKTKVQLNVPFSDLGVQSKTEQRCLGPLLEDLDMPVKNPMPQFEGFRTASRKTIQISDEAKIRASRILIDLPEIPQKQEKPVPVAIDEITKAEIEAAVLIAKDFQDNIFSEWPRTGASETQKTNAGTAAAVKRKSTNDEIDLGSKWLCKSNSSSLQQQRSPLNRIENASELRRSPSKSATISRRRNLLSLSKRKKNRPTSLGSSGSGSIGPSPNVETPTKSSTNNRPNEQTPDTPNVHEFFDLLSKNTSTPARPAPIKGGAPNSLATARALNLVEEEEEEQETVVDFCHIKWKRSNDYLPPHRFEANSKTVVHSKSVGAAACANTSGGSSSNLSLNASATTGKPTAQERIERLRMYGKPPALPLYDGIRENNNCRPSGLSRSAAGRGLSLNKSKK